MGKNEFLRGLNTSILMLTCLGNSIIVQALSTINKQITQYLPGVTSTQVSLSALLFMILHAIFSIPVNYILDKYPLKLGISINCVMVCVGLVLRLFVLKGFGFVIAGNFIAAIGNIFLLNCPAKYSAIWYQPKQRLLITSLIVLANCISGGLGGFLSPFVVKQNLPIEQGQKQIQKLMFYQAVIIGSFMLINLLFFRGSPDRYCQNLTKKTEQHHQPYSKTLKQLFTNRNFLLPFFCMMTYLSVANSVITNISLLITPFGFTSKEAGVNSMIGVVGGIIGAVILSMIITRTRKYKKTLLGLYISTIIVLVMSGLSIQFTIVPLFYITSFLFGFFVFPSISVLIQYACEGLYPVGEATVSGITLGGGQIASFFIGLLQAYILQAKTRKNCYFAQAINIGLLITCSIIFSFTKQRLLRLQNKQTKNNESLLSKDQNQSSLIMS